VLCGAADSREEKRLKGSYSSNEYQADIGIHEELKAHLVVLSILNNC
jgi:hypothetical protein